MPSHEASSLKTATHPKKTDPLGVFVALTNQTGRVSLGFACRRDYFKTRLSGRTTLALDNFVVLGWKFRAYVYEGSYDCAWFLY
jgi:hypothetical protein